MNFHAEHIDARGKVVVTPDFDTMNETDVREIIVRPLLARLGYAHGTEANIRTEVPLRYARAFLGRKSPDKDPALRGRADYICDAVSYGRWVVEVKSPQDLISQDDVEQAHTYSAHPEISASHFMLTNGREFRLYATGRLEEPILQWTFDEMEDRMLALFNVVSPAAIRRLNAIITPDVGKPLGEGLPSRIDIIGGDVRYGEHISNVPLLNPGIEGMETAVTGVGVERAADGRLQATVSIRSLLPQVAEIHKAFHFDRFEFYSSDEYVSSDVNKPTIFQNVMQGRIEPGLEVPVTIVGGIKSKIPFGMEYHVVTQAIGFAGDHEIVGLANFDYNYKIFGRMKTGLPLLDQLPSDVQMTGSAEFRLVWRPRRP